MSETSEERHVPVVLISLYAAYTLFSVTGLLVLKNYMPLARAAASAGHLISGDTLGAAAGAASYIASFLIWLVILAQVPVSRAYPVAIGLTLSCTALGSVVVLGEKLAPAHIAGIATVFVGVLLISIPASS
jgi:multidrug transporter EmrE-like cation transporter